MNAKAVRVFKNTVWRYYRARGRTLPWRETRDPYAIAVSEIMLQQTQVSRVLVKYFLFLQRFPDFEALARASVGEVLGIWQGLGYNRRALNLKRLAERVVRDYASALPRDPELLAKLPGIGKATAGSIAAFAFDAPTLFIETNIRRVLLHFFFPDATRKIADDELFPILEAVLDRTRPREWYYALMDYGAMLPRITENPNRRSAHHRAQPPFKGSRRALRGEIVCTLTKQEAIRHRELAAHCGADVRFDEVLAALEEEGFLVRKGAWVRIA